MRSIFLKHFYKDLVFNPFSLIFFLILSFVPVFVIITHFVHKIDHTNDLLKRLELLHKKSQHASKKKDVEENILFKMKGADPHYIDKYLESLTFLESEAKKWQRLAMQEKPIAEIEKRIEFLRGQHNKLSFTEGQIYQIGNIRELEEKQKHPVEINDEDLKKILCLIEGVKIGPYIPVDKHPQLIIKKFDLTKKIMPDIREKVFLLNLQLLKRELIEET
jgi:hypothetical protein